MKILKYLAVGILGLLIVSSVVSFFYMQSLKPNYEGELALDGINQPVEILFDDFGVPHIYAQTEADAYYALGYAHAQERLFQMELVSRLSTGRLAEVLGPDLITTDKFFRTIDIEGKAEEFAAGLEKSNEPYAIATRAYFEGVNAFVDTGFTPIEFTIIGIPMRQYSPKDAYLTIGYLSFGFAEGFRIDPMVAKIESTLGQNYLNDLELHYTAGTEKIPVSSKASAFSEPVITAIHEAINGIPVPLWSGSNGWAIGDSKTAGDGAILENDTHIAFAQPAVWYEAHLEYPGKSFYGKHAAMVPFGVLGHNRFGVWGLTMFENDDADFFKEEINDKNQYKDDSVWLDLIYRKEIIKVKGQEDIVLEIKETKRGPIINSVIENIDHATKDPTSVWWAFHYAENDLLQIVYEFDHHSSIEEMEAAVAKIEAPGLNVMYANKNNDIAWWAAGKLPLRPAAINSKTLNNGSGVVYDRFIPFQHNPKDVNPSSGYVYSANNQPDSVMGMLIPGYYVPEDRAKRIIELLSANDQWTLEQVKEMTADHTSPIHPLIAQEIAGIVNTENTEALNMLQTWDGSHGKESVAPTIYYAVLGQIIHDAIADELGETGFNEFGSSHLMKRSYAYLIKNDSSIWWDDTNTDTKESRSDIFTAAFAEAVQVLTAEYGNEIKDWKWGKAHTLTHPHPLAEVKPLDKIFNVGPFEVPAGIAVINNLMFPLGTTGHNEVSGGPSMRTILNTQDLEHGYTILPTGQSGNIMSPHYDDQAKMFAENEFRPMMMIREEIEASGSTILVLNPTKK